MRFVAGCRFLVGTVYRLVFSRGKANPHSCGTDMCLNEGEATTDCFLFDQTRCLEKEESTNWTPKSMLGFFLRCRGSTATKQDTCKTKQQVNMETEAFVCLQSYQVSLGLFFSDTHS